MKRKFWPVAMLAADLAVGDRVWSSAYERWLTVEEYRFFPGGVVVACHSAATGWVYLRFPGGESVRCLVERLLSRLEG